MIEEYYDLVCDTERLNKNKTILPKNIREGILTTLPFRDRAQLQRVCASLKLFPKGSSVRDVARHVRHSILTDIGELAEPRYATSRPPNQ